MDILKKNLLMFILGVVTLVLGIVAVSMVIRLYKGGTNTSPISAKQTSVVTTSNCSFTFILKPTTIPSLTPTEEIFQTTITPTQAKLTKNNTPTPTKIPTATPTSKTNITPTPTTVKTLTGTPTPVTKLTITPTSTIKPTSTSTPKLTNPTPTPIELPQAGITGPTVSIILGGISLITLAILLFL